MAAKRKTVTLAELRAAPSSETCPECGATKNNWWQCESCAAPSLHDAGRMSEEEFERRFDYGKPDPLSYPHLLVEARRAREAEAFWFGHVKDEIRQNEEKDAEIADLKRRITELEAR
jgi:hypothetical protein